MITITATLLLAWLLMISQAMESMTRAFYARADLDLILASPAAAHKLFAIRISTVALTVAAMAVPLAGPFIDMLILRGGMALARRVRRHHRHGHGGCGAGGGDDGGAVPRHRPEAHPPRRPGGRRGDRRCLRHRPAGGGDPVLRHLVAGDVLRSDALFALAPDAGSVMWWPARAVLGEAVPLAGVLIVSFVLLAVAVALVAPRFGDYAVAAAGAEMRRRSARGGAPRSASPRRAARCAARSGCCCAAIRGWCRRR